MNPHSIPPPISIAQPQSSSALFDQLKQTATHPTSITNLHRRGSSSSCFAVIPPASLSANSNSNQGAFAQCTSSTSNNNHISLSNGESLDYVLETNTFDYEQNINNNNRFFPVVTILNGPCGVQQHNQDNITAETNHNNDTNTSSSRDINNNSGDNNKGKLFRFHEEASLFNHFLQVELSIEASYLLQLHQQESTADLSLFSMPAMSQTARSSNEEALFSVGGSGAQVQEQSRQREDHACWVFGQRVRIEEIATKPHYLMKIFKYKLDAIAALEKSIIDTRLEAESLFNPPKVNESQNKSTLTDYFKLKRGSFSSANTNINSTANEKRKEDFYASWLLESLSEARGDIRAFLHMVRNQLVDALWYRFHHYATVKVIDGDEDDDEMEDGECKEGKGDSKHNIQKALVDKYMESSFALVNEMTEILCEQFLPVKLHRDKYLLRRQSELGAEIAMTIMAVYFKFIVRACAVFGTPAVAEKVSTLMAGRVSASSSSSSSSRTSSHAPSPVPRDYCSEDDEVVTLRLVIIERVFISFVGIQRRLLSVLLGNAIECPRLLEEGGNACGNITPLLEAVLLGNTLATITHTGSLPSSLKPLEVLCVGEIMMYMQNTSSERGIREGGVACLWELLASRMDVECVDIGECDFHRKAKEKCERIWNCLSVVVPLVCAVDGSLDLKQHIQDWTVILKLLKFTAMDVVYQNEMSRSAQNVDMRQARQYAERVLCRCILLSRHWQLNCVELLMFLWKYFKRNQMLDHRNGVEIEEQASSSWCGSLVASKSDFVATKIAPVACHKLFQKTTMYSSQLTNRENSLEKDKNENDAWLFQHLESLNPLSPSKDDPSIYELFLCIVSITVLTMSELKSLEGRSTPPNVAQIIIPKRMAELASCAGDKQLTDGRYYLENPKQVEKVCTRFVVGIQSSLNICDADDTGKSGILYRNMQLLLTLAACSPSDLKNLITCKFIALLDRAKSSSFLAQTIMLQGLYRLMTICQYGFEDITSIAESYREFMDLAISRYKHQMRKYQNNPLMLSNLKPKLESMKRVAQTGISHVFRILQQGMSVIDPGWACSLDSVSGTAFYPFCCCGESSLIGDWFTILLEPELSLFDKKDCVLDPLYLILSYRQHNAILLSALEHELGVQRRKRRRLETETEDYFFDVDDGALLAAAMQMEESKCYYIGGSKIDLFLSEDVKFRTAINKYIFPSLSQLVHYRKTKGDGSLSWNVFCKSLCVYVMCASLNVCANETSWWQFLSRDQILVEDTNQPLGFDVCEVLLGFISYACELEYLTFHHYGIDSAIWKCNQNGELPYSVFKGMCQSELHSSTSPTCCPLPDSHTKIIRIWFNVLLEQDNVASGRFVDAVAGVVPLLLTTTKSKAFCDVVASFEKLCHSHLKNGAFCFLNDKSKRMTPKELYRAVFNCFNGIGSVCKLQSERFFNEGKEKDYGKYFKIACSLLCRIGPLIHSYDQEWLPSIMSDFFAPKVIWRPNMPKHRIEVAPEAAVELPLIFSHKEEFLLGMATCLDMHKNSISFFLRKTIDFFRMCLEKVHLPVREKKKTALPSKTIEFIAGEIAGALLQNTQNENLTVLRRWVYGAICSEYIAVDVGFSLSDQLWEVGIDIMQASLLKLIEKGCKEHEIESEIVFLNMYSSLYVGVSAITPYICTKRAASLDFVIAILRKFRFLKQKCFLHHFVMALLVQGCVDILFLWQSIVGVNHEVIYEHNLKYVPASSISEEEWVQEKKRHHEMLQTHQVAPVPFEGINVPPLSSRISGFFRGESRAREYKVESVCFQYLTKQCELINAAQAHVETINHTAILS
eukprot:Nk52_evm4s318 gene=Nk52_evmTU4s318